jgi:hypothetical protein
VISAIAFDGFLWLVISLGPFLFVQRWLHRELQALLLLITRRQGLSLGLFSLFFFPGVLLHESSHYVMARVLGVKTGRLSLLPELTETGKLRMGYVETEQAGAIADALIGTAPLLAGGAVIAFLGSVCLGLSPLAAFMHEGDWASFWQGLLIIPERNDFWLWFYLAFAVSSTMLPSASDRYSWRAVGIGLGLILLALVIGGAGPWMLENFGPWLNQALLGMALIFGISLTLHLALALPIWGLRRLVSRITGLKVVLE